MHRFTRIGGAVVLHWSEQPLKFLSGYVDVRQNLAQCSFWQRRDLGGPGPSCRARLERRMM